jgi:hypothetical protein
LWAADRILLPAADEEINSADSMLLKPPKELIGAAWLRVLSSHCINSEMVTLIARGQILDFLSARQEALQSLLTTFLRQRCEWEFENTPPLSGLVLDDEPDLDEESDVLF